MTSRKIYQPTEKQIEKWNAFGSYEIPSDEILKSRWAEKHHGKVAGWGLGKREWIIDNLKSTYEYQHGLWQARVDFVQGLGYQGEEVTDENANAYRLGYYRGWNDGCPLKGIDKPTIDRLNREYGSN